MPELVEFYDLIKSIKPELPPECQMMILKYGLDESTTFTYNLEVLFRDFDKLFDEYLHDYIYGNKEKRVKSLDTLIRTGKFSRVNDIFDDINESIILPCEIIYGILRKHPELKKYYAGKVLTTKEIGLVESRASALLNRAMISSIPLYDTLIDETFKDIIGQAGAKAKVKKLLLRKNIENAISTKSKVITMLFTGPTGTGKTQTCKNMAQLLYGSERNMLRIDMNEYRSDEVGVNTLKGMPRGYKDAETKSQFVQFISTHKEGIILIDEFEKEFDPIKNFFYKIIDEGWFEDNQGRKYNISRYIIVATTNAYSRNETDNIFGVKSEATSKSMMECLNDKLGSALVGRFNAIVEYLELTREEAIDIIKLNLVKSLEKKIKNVAASTRTNIVVEYSPSIEEFAERLLEDNHDQFKQNGARVLIEQVESIWDLVIPELALVYVGGLKEYEKSKVLLSYGPNGVDVTCKKMEHGPLSYTNVKR